MIDAWLEQDLPLPEIQAALQRALPPGLQVAQIETVDLRLPALQTVLEASEYHVTFLEPFPELADRAQALLSTPSLPRRRRERDYDLRPLVLDMHALPPDHASDASHSSASAWLPARAPPAGPRKCSKCWATTRSWRVSTVPGLLFRTE